MAVDNYAAFREALEEEPVMPAGDPPIPAEAPIPVADPSMPAEAPAEVPPPAPPAPPSWEEMSGGKVKSVEDFDKIYNIASKFANNDDAVKVAQMWMSGEDIEPLLDLRRTNFDKMDIEDLFYREWSSKNSEIANDPELTSQSLRDEFMEYLQEKYPGYDPYSETNGLNEVKNKKFKKDAEALRSGFNDSKSSALQLKLDKAMAQESAPKGVNDGPPITTPEAMEKSLSIRKKDAEDFASYDMDDFEGEKVSIPVPGNWKAVATAIAEDPIGAVDAEFFEGENLDHMKLQKAMFLFKNRDMVAKYFYDLGKGATGEEQAIALGQKAPPPPVALKEAGGDLEETIARMEAKQRPRY